MDERKNLATCKPSEFLAQTAKIRKAVQNWLSVTDILNIRKERPQIIMIPKDATPEEVVEIQAQNRLLTQEQAKKNLTKMLDSILEEHPQETLALLGLLCFVEPEDVDNHPVSFYLANIGDILNDKDVLSFFTSLAQLEQTDILKA